MKKFLSHTGVRWAAVIILLLAYILVSQGLISGVGLVFNGLNCLGSLIMIANSLSLPKKDWPVAVFNVVWVLIALVTMAGALL
ncbi:MAG: hypothetical protein ACD_61C00197G0004 [uncultured bacterium]|nr:MAG: hypothetical protein ACD_61C00197G0004 [uncultured bacterium]